MHHQPGVARTARGEKTGEAKLLPRSQALRRQRKFSDRHRGKLTAHFPFQPAFDLAGQVGDPEFQDRDTGGGSAQRTDLGRLAIENQRVEPVAVRHQA